MSLAPGLFLVAAALGVAFYAMFASPVTRVSLDRRRPPGNVKKSPLSALTDAMVEFVDHTLRSRGWLPFTARELELAAVRMTPGYLVVLVSILAFIAAMLAGTLSRSPLVGLLAAVAVPLMAKLVLRHLAGKRRKAFDGQLDETLQLLAAALRAGHGLTRAFDTVSKETDPPMSEELARVVNENRIGRDLVDAVGQTAERMQNVNFRWVAEAVGIQQETGGNLNEVLDKVGSTIRERNKLLRDVRTLSAEGRMSAMVLVALPFLTVAGLSFLNPDFMRPLYTTSTGLIAFVVSGVLLTVGIVWMKIIVNVKV